MGGEGIARKLLWKVENLWFPCRQSCNKTRGGNSGRSPNWSAPHPGQEKQIALLLMGEHSRLVTFARYP